MSVKWLKKILTKISSSTNSLCLKSSETYATFFTTSDGGGRGRRLLVNNFRRYGFRRWIKIQFWFIVWNHIVWNCCPIFWKMLLAGPDNLASIFIAFGGIIDDFDIIIHVGGSGNYLYSPFFWNVCRCCWIKITGICESLDGDFASPLRRTK